ncbi:unnamed protein product [Phytophthora lilii]|uniref:Unnamed protein product n=1 Tax=Phytophthora lilii TaxID=2077276 RepID=A0A9W6X6K2_9STRA|nr:unnamed protein product [Phytophthora lilii]
MAVRKINAAIRHLDWDAVEHALLRDDDSGEPEPIKLCAVSATDWNRYIWSDEFQAVRSKYMEWRDGTVWLVEYGWSIHGSAASEIDMAMASATGTNRTHLVPHGVGWTNSPPPGQQVVAQPDCSFGPHRTVGAVLPREFERWWEYDTVKVEIGVSVGWPGLNRKSAIWRQYTGVEYVLSIRLSPALRIREYRLEQCVNGEFPGENDANRASIFCQSIRMQC